MNTKTDGTAEGIRLADTLPNGRYTIRGYVAANCDGATSERGLWRLPSTTKADRQRNASRQAGADHLNSIRHGTAETGMIRESSGRGVSLNRSPIECKQPPGRGGCSAGRALFLFFRGRSLESYRLAGLANVRQFDRQHPSISKITFCDLNLSFNALYVL